MRLAEGDAELHPCARRQAEAVLQGADLRIEGLDVAQQRVQDGLALVTFGQALAGGHAVGALALVIHAE